jgi:hypothetical protein
MTMLVAHTSHVVHKRFYLLYMLPSYTYLLITGLVAACCCATAPVFLSPGLLSFCCSELPFLLSRLRVFHGGADTLCR